MKNTLKYIGPVSLGLALVLGISNSEAVASDDVPTDVKKESKLLSITIPNVPIVGDANISIPSKTSDDEEKDHALVSVEVTDGILDELNVSVAAESKTEEGDSKKALASIEVKSSITNDVTVDVASTDNQESSIDGGLVEINAEDLPLLRETHVGIIDKHVESGNDSESFSAGLVQVDIDGDLLKDTSVDVIAAETSKNAEGWEFNSAVANVSNEGGILDGLVDELDLTILENHQLKTADSELSKQTIASVGLKSPLTKDLNGDVGLLQSQMSEDTMAFDIGLVEVNAEDLPLLGDTHIGLLDRHTKAEGEEISFTSSLAQVNVDGGLLNDTAIKVLATEVEMTDEGYAVTSGVLQTDLALLDSDSIAIDLITSQQLYPDIIEEDTSNGNGNDDGTSKPGDSNGNSTLPTVITPLPDGDSSSGNTDDSTTKPGANNEVSDSNQDNENNSIFPSIIDSGSNNRNPADQGDDTNQNALLGTNSSVKVVSTIGSIEENAMDRSIAQYTLPKTGGLFDSKRLVLLGLLLIILGVVLRKFGNPANFETLPS